MSNDDGYRAEGIVAISAALSEWADVVVVAPDRERSGCGHAITLDHPLRMRQLNADSRSGRWYLVDGTPTDCINLGLHVLFAGSKPDLVVSGINHGVNLGNDVTYSGTVGGALEGQNYNVPAFALSQRIDGPYSFERTAQAASELIKKSLSPNGLVQGAQGRAKSPLFNVNFPLGEIQGYEMTVLGKRTYRDSIAPRRDPRGRDYYWIAGAPNWDASPGTDMATVQEGRVSVTPLTADLTEFGLVEPLRAFLA